MPWLPRHFVSSLHVILKFFEEELLLAIRDKDRRVHYVTVRCLFRLDRNKFWLYARSKRFQALKHQFEAGKRSEGEVGPCGFRLIFRGFPGSLELFG